MKILFSFIILIISLEVYGQMDSSLLKTKRFDFKTIEKDTSRAVKEENIKAALKSWPNDAINLEYNLNDVFIVDLNKDNLYDVIYTGYNEYYYDGNTTVIFINKGTFFSIYGPEGIITNINITNSPDSIKFTTYENACCNDPFDSYGLYLLDFSNDSLTKKIQYLTPRMSDNNVFKFPTKHLIKPETTIITKEKELYLDYNGTRAYYFENQNLCESEIKVKIIAIRNGFLFVEIDKQNDKTVETKIFGWVKK